MGLLRNLIVRIKGDNTDLDNKLNKSESSISKWGKRIAAVFAAAFSVKVVTKFFNEVAALAGAAEGVRAAFDKLNNPLLLSQLRKATRGTVDDITLMQKAVQARNFKIPLDQLATYFEFATNRAIETGESVDYLVDSIITGIGRKSVLVMDNLGISAVELQEEVKKIGDFGAAAGVIIRRELTSMGEVADTTATKIESINTAWKNLKAGLGKSLVNTKGFQGLLNWVSDLGKIAQVPGMSLPQALMATIFKRKEIIEIIEEGEKKITEEYKKQTEALKEAERVTTPSRQLVSAPGKASSGQLAFPNMFSPAGLAGAPNVSPPDWLTTMLDNWQATIDNAKWNIIDSATELVEGLFAAMSGGDWSEFGKNMLMGFANFLSMLGKLLIAFAAAESGFLAASSNPLAWPVALAAGIAAVAAAGIIKGVIGSGAKAMTVGGTGGGYGGGGGQASAGQMKVVIEGKLVGRDIYWSNRRYEDELNAAT